VVPSCSAALYQTGPEAAFNWISRSKWGWIDRQQLPSLLDEAAG